MWPRGPVDPRPAERNLDPASQVPEADRPDLDLKLGSAGRPGLVREPFGNPEPNAIFGVLRPLARPAPGSPPLPKAIFGVLVPPPTRPPPTSPPPTGRAGLLALNAIFGTPRRAALPAPGSAPVPKAILGVFAPPDTQP